jgi:eukaryotic-like serine/threonine-protein kinase
MLGKTIDGRYQVLRLLGQGGMGAVYEVRHLGTGRRHALKIITGELAATPDVVARFMREGRAVGAIESQHVVQVTDSGIDTVEGIPFMGR